MVKLASIFLSGGFRPFFLFAGLNAIFNMLVWVGYLTGNLEIYSQFSPTQWHSHEMMFGFIGAAMAGFVLTAVPNWTSRPALTGLNLASLVGLWLLGRVAVYYSELTGAFFAAFADLPFLFILSLYIYKQISAQGNLRNLPIVILVFLFGCANALMHIGYVWELETAEYGFRLSITLISTMIMLLGGRIIPNFTLNWLKQHGQTNQPVLMNKFDLFCIIWSAFALFTWVLMPQYSLTGYLLLVAGILQALRLARWQTLAILKQPIILVLHIAYLWLAVGLTLLGLFIIFDAGSIAVPIHCLTVGVFANMIVGVMTRASLGHSGRKIIASKTTVASYICINFAGVSRILAAYVGDFETPLLHISALSWLLCFGLFLYQYTPYFFTARK